MRQMKTMISYPPLMMVEWVDATNIAEWTDLSEIGEWAKSGAYICRNVGWLVYEDEECICLAGRISLAIDPHQAGLIERIPKSIIVGQWTLRRGSGGPL